jgi:CheY-like chemotaxis protein/ribosome-binding protein aMBF1 (putative translation factor)
MIAMKKNSPTINTNGDAGDAGAGGVGLAVLNGIGERLKAKGRRLKAKICRMACQNFRETGSSQIEGKVYYLQSIEEPHFWGNVDRSSMQQADIISRFGASVRRLRFRLGVTQQDLAERAGLHQTYIAGIERGNRNVTLKSLVKLAHALQVSTAALLESTTHAQGGGEGTRRPARHAECADILMVEDNRDDVDLALAAFKQARITNTVQVLRDGRQALDFLSCTGNYARRKKGQSPHLVLLDLGLPKVSGLEVLRRIKADPNTRSIPVVVLTASHDSKELAECLLLGAETYIVKPVDFNGLSQATPRLRLDWALLKPAPAAGRSTQRL